MKTSAFGTREIGRPGIERLLLALAAVLALAAAGCDEGHEGDRCVAALTHNDCASSDLVCTQPANCPETYCCPVSGMSSNPYCQPGCGGGGLSIAFAMVGGSCSSSTPNQLCSCLNIVNGIIVNTLPQGGPGCQCVNDPDPLGCLAAEGGTPEAGSPADGSSESSTMGPETSTVDGPSETSTVDSPSESSSMDGSFDAPGQ